MYPRLHYADVAWETSEMIDTWVKQLLDPHPLESSLSKAVKRVPLSYVSLLPAGVGFAGEKVCKRVANMRYIRNETPFLGSFIYHWRNTDQNPLKVGPFTVMYYTYQAADAFEFMSTVS
ncbi:hypothetical protein F1880_001680 [Penicillium rolfsii]|nr:hypothetical protein F1880_001680 [Penicillium rolfsii]